MKLSLLAMLALPVAMYAQDSTSVVSTETYPNTFSSGSANVQKFDNAARLFNDWSVSIGGGGAFMQSADLTSFYDDKINWGYTAYVGLQKQISHVFGLGLQYNMGKTNQKAMYNASWGVGEAWTKYHQINLLGDINFSNLMRRVDNHSPYRWALHGYAGIGLEGYETYLKDNSTRWNNPLDIKQDLNIASFYYVGGAGLSYKISKLIDVETRVMYYMSGDDEFDGGGWENSMVQSGIGVPREVDYPYNFIKKNNSDNFFTVTLGLNFKLGKHISHLMWHDPLQEAYYRTSLLENGVQEFIVCERGDGDNDGVCDDWDRQLDTPAGARVDGAGVALDMDLDTVIDLYDKCVTVPGPVDNNGCPAGPVPTNDSKITEINKDFEGIEFELNKDIIRTSSFEKLNHAADVIKSLDANSQFYVIGATDTRGSDTYNQNLSQRRAAAVVKYLTDKGVNSGMLIAEGHGEKDLKYPECEPATKCPEWKNEANRRVYFKAK